MARKKDESTKDEPLEPQADAEPEDTSEGDELLPEASAAPARSGGSGAFIAIVVVFVVIVLAVAAYLHREKRRAEEKDRRDRQMQVLGTQLGAVQTNVGEAMRRVEDDPPDIDGAIEALNTAASQIGELALSPSAVDSGLSPSLVDLQARMRTASQALDARSAQYEEAVAAARQELKTGSQADVKPLSAKLDTLITGAYGDIDTPLRVPGVSSVAGGEPAAEPAAGAATEPAAGAEAKTESP